MKFSPSTNREHFKAITNSSSIETFALKPDDELLESLKALPDDINFDESDGVLNTILYLAAANNCVTTVKYLIHERKVNPNVKVTENLTATHIAAMQGFTDVLTSLFDNDDIMLNEQDNFGETPLFRAICNAPEKSLVETVRLLVKKCPETASTANEDGTTPLEVALQRKQLPALHLLIDSGAIVTKGCQDSAITMMLSESQDSSLFEGSSVFFFNTEKKNIICKCCELIVETYNAQHRLEDAKHVEPVKSATSTL